MKMKCVDMLTMLRTATRSLLHPPVLAAACVLLATSLEAQTVQKHPTPSLNGRKSPGTAAQKLPEAAPEPPAAEPPPPPPRHLTPEEMPPKAPEVSWDGQLLTITSDNSTLADILTTVRTLTGAELDIPPTAFHERIAARLGPGSAREILSTLLSWTDFDYVIQASDANPDLVSSVTLTPRSKSEVIVAKAGPGVLAESQSRYANRIPARSNPGPNAEVSPAPENTAATQSESPGEAPQPGSQPGTSDSQPATATAQLAPADAPTASAAAPVVAADVQPSTTDLPPTSTISDTSTNQASMSEPEQRVQHMQDLFQQRKQMMDDTKKPPAN